MRTDHRAPVLIIHSDAEARAALRGVLERAGYSATETTDSAAGLDVLTASDRGMVVLFNVVLFRNMLAGTDSVGRMGALASDRRLAERHAYIATTPTPDMVWDVLGRLFARLSVPIVPQPCEEQMLLDAVARAEEQLSIAV